MQIVHLEGQLVLIDCHSGLWDYNKKKKKKGRDLNKVDLSVRIAYMGEDRGIHLF